MERNQIGENAGIIWRALNGKGNLSFEQLQGETQLDSADILLAVGWLARENKISLIKNNGVTTIQLYQETYY